jgi:hypothetical protein
MGTLRQVLSAIMNNLNTLGSRSTEINRSEIVDDADISVCGSAIST